MASAASRSDRRILVGTRKGAFVLALNPASNAVRIEGPLFLGHIIHHIVQDPRDRRTLLMAAKTGHLGPTLYRSTDSGRAWKEAKRPPAFRKAKRGGEKRAVDQTFWLTPGHASRPGMWYAGTSPIGLFRSEDAGETWTPIDAFHDHPSRSEWHTGPIPGGAMAHSILVDPRDPDHLYVSVSNGGTFESTDGGRDWRPLWRGLDCDFMPDQKGDLVYGHDPHCVVQHPLQPDRLYQQNHCGLYRMDRPSETWVRIGRNMPKEIGDIGFPIVLHPRDPDTVWVFPMDGTTVWPRVSPGGRPAVYRTRDAGATWSRQDRGLPKSQAWFTVKRQAFCADAGDPVGLYFGTTQGEVWMSRDAGAHWTCAVRHLPEIYSVTVAESRK